MTYETPGEPSPLTLEEKMHSGQLYDASLDIFDPDLQAKYDRQKDLLYTFNLTRPTELDRRDKILREVFAAVGANCYIEPPLYANWGCYTTIGDNFYANFGLTLVDDAPVTIGNDVMIAPHVTLVTGTHPIHPDLRQRALQYNQPVTIGNRVWIGAGAVVMPGVTIGDGSVIGAGSVVTKDVPPNVVAVGVPCRVLREITDRDLEVYDHDRPVRIL